MCECSDGCLGDWSCHQLAVEMTVDYWAAATLLPCGTSGMTCNFLTITFKMDSNSTGLGLSGGAGVTALLTDPNGWRSEG